MSATQKEDVLLMVKHVRNKKVDGALYINSGRVAWRSQSADSFKLSAAFEDIRCQRISPDGKEKVQLQLLMHNGDSFTFQFADPAGRTSQLEARNRVKEALQALLPKFKDKAHSELGEKFRILQSQPELKLLYKELVVSGIITADEFWARPQFNATSSSSNGQQPSTRGRHHQLDPPQQPGLPSCLLGDVRPVDAADSGGVKYRLDQDSIQAIFRTYPQVERQHRQSVPSQMSESEFWSAFFQSHYFHRDRTQLPKGDLFTECAASDERLFRDEVKKFRRRQDAALAGDGDLVVSDSTNYDLADSDYGLQSALADNTNNEPPPSTDSKSTATTSKQMSANQLLIHRINCQSLMVLKSLAATSSSNAGAGASSSNKPPKEELYANELDRASQDSQEEPHLQLSGLSDFLDGPTTGQQQQSTLGRKRQLESSGEDLLEQALTECQSTISQSYHPIDGRLLMDSTLCPPYDAQLALADLSPGGCLVAGSRGTGGGGASDLHLTADQRRQLAHLYSSGLELARHCWACLPLSSPALIDKARNLLESSLPAFRSSKLGNRGGQGQLLHLECMLDACEARLGQALAKIDSTTTLNSDVNGNTIS